MGYQTTRGIPIPFGFEGNNVPADLGAFASRVEELLRPHTYAEISAFGGTDTSDSRIVYQTDAGTLRPFIGFYVYRAVTANWQPLLTMGVPPAWPTAPVYSTSGGGEAGTGGTITSRVARFGPLVLGRGSITLPSTGFNAGTNFVRLSLPYPNGAAESDVVGWCQFIDVSAAARRTYQLIAVPSATYAQPNLGAAATTSPVSVTSPIILAASDVFHYRLMYLTDQS
jgi:hypothetical protein